MAEKDIRDVKQEINQLEREAVQIAKDHFKIITKQVGAQTDLADVASKKRKDGEFDKRFSEDTLKTTLKNLKASKAQRQAIMETAPGFFNMAAGAKQTLNNLRLMAKSTLGVLGIIGLAVGAFVKFQKAVTDTRKELGVSQVQAAAITGQNIVLAQVAKGYGLDLSDIQSAQAAIRNDLGASVQESVNLSLSFARTAAATGQTSEQLTSTLSIMESISSASRDVLLNQLRTSAAIIGQAGVSPALVMRDLAENAEFFAQFAKDGGSNLIGAGIAARKLGLNMSAVASISESLLDFESSIEKQLEASLLLGRQINLDRARQLALTGDQEGLMGEILKQVGGEAEFNRMNVIQRKALAESVGVNVEQLSRLVRNNTAGGTAGAVGAAVGGANPMVGLQEETNSILRSGFRKLD